MISAVSWVPRGAAKLVPVVSEPTEEELEALRAQALAEASASRRNEDNSNDSEDEGTMDEDEDEDEYEEEVEEEEKPAERARAVAAALGSKKSDAKASNHKGEDLAGDLAELDMEHYDDEDDTRGELRIFGNGGLGAAFYVNNEDDPYLTLKDEDDEDEIDDFTIRETDLLILTARNEDDVSHLEVWVYEEGQSGMSAEESTNMYVHHDVMLPSFPLALAWLDFSTRSTSSDRGNLVAVGTMDPEIEIWDLDVVDDVEPVAVLGGPIREKAAPVVDDKSKKSKGKKKKQGRLLEGSHSDAVLGLAWNTEFRNVLASASADNTVKLWDMAVQRCEHTLSHHTDKVQAVAWNPREAPVLLSGSFDRTAALADMRAPLHAALRWGLSADVECLAWDPHTAHCFVASTEDGMVRCFDVRKGAAATGAGMPGAGAASESLFTLHAHEKATCAVSFSPGVPNLLATASTDKSVKLWDVEEHRPSCLASKNPKVGAIFSISFCKDSPFLLAVGGSKGTLYVWETLAEQAVSKQYGKAVRL